MIISHSNTLADLLDEVAQYVEIRSCNSSVLLNDKVINLDLSNESDILVWGALLSDIYNKYTDLTKDQIEALRKI